MKLKVGDKAPNFKLEDQNGKEHSLSSYIGYPILLYFYPKDNTPGCTIEACGIRDKFAVFKSFKATVIGISTDSVISHNKFSKKYNLPFTLLADENKEVVKTYGVFFKKRFMDREYEGVKRTSFLINYKGNIEKIYEDVKAAEHAKEVIYDISR